MDFDQHVEGIGAAGDHVSSLQIEDQLSGAGSVSFRIYQRVVDEVGGSVPAIGDWITATLTAESNAMRESGEISVEAKVERVSEHYDGEGTYHEVEAVTAEAVLGRTRFLWTDADTRDLLGKDPDPEPEAGTLPEHEPPWERVPTQQDEERVDLAEILEHVADDLLGYDAEAPSVWVSDYVSEYRALSELCDQIARESGTEWRIVDGAIQFADAWGDPIELERTDFEADLEIEQDASELYNVVRGYAYEYDVHESTSPGLDVRHQVFGGYFMEKKHYAESQTLEAWRTDLPAGWEAWDEVYIANVTYTDPVAKTLRSLIARMDLQVEDGDHYPEDPEEYAELGDEASADPADWYLRGSYEDGIIELEDAYQVISGRRDAVEATEPPDWKGRYVTEHGFLDEQLTRVTYDPPADWSVYEPEDTDISNVGPLTLEARIPIRRGVWVERRDEDSISTYGLREAPPLDEGSEEPLDIVESEVEAYLAKHSTPKVRISGTCLRPVKLGQIVKIDGHEILCNRVSWSVSGNQLDITVEAGGRENVPLKGIARRIERRERPSARGRGRIAARRARGEG